MITKTIAVVVLVLRMLFPWETRTGQHAGCGTNAVGVWELRARLRAEHGGRRGMCAGRHEPCHSTA